MFGSTENEYHEQKNEGYLKVFKQIVWPNSEYAVCAWYPYLLRHIELIY